MDKQTLLEALGGEVGCQRLATEFYGRVKGDPILQPLFPGKTLRCATEEFGSFLVQFLGGDEAQTQHRWWLSLHESHARFQISPEARAAWLKHMAATLDALPLDAATRQGLRQFFGHSAAYVTDKANPAPKHNELAARWREQRLLDDAISLITQEKDQEVLVAATHFADRPSVLVGLLARMLETGRPALIQYVVDTLERMPSLATHYFAGKTLLHFAAGAGCLEVVAVLLRLGMDPNSLDNSEHTPLYWVANGSGAEVGPQIVHALVDAGADVNASGGVTGATALHMAARRGHVEIARALLECGATLEAQDRKGETPLQRAINCRKGVVAQLLKERAATSRKTSRTHIAA